MSGSQREDRFTEATLDEWYRAADGTEGGEPAGPVVQARDRKIRRLIDQIRQLLSERDQGNANEVFATQVNKGRGGRRKGPGESVNERRQLRSDAWLERAADEITSSTKRRNRGEALAILRKHRDGKA